MSRAGLGLLLVSRLAVAAGPDGRWLFRVYAREDGLSDPNPYVLTRDRAGILWAGAGNGLFRFDGKSFSRFGEADGLPDAAVTGIAQRPDGRLYVGTRGGLVRWDGAAFVPAGAGLPAGPVTALAASADGTLYAATPKGLFLTIEEQFGQDKGEAGGPVAVTALALAPDAVYFARDGRVWRRQGGRTTEYGSAFGLEPAARIDALHVDGSGALWVRSAGRLDVLSPGAARFVSRSALLPPGTGGGPLAAGDANDVLVPTGKGLLAVTANSSRLLGRHAGLPGESILAAFVDREGILWAAVAGEGLARRLGDSEIAALSADDGLPAGGVRAVARAPDGALLLGTVDGLFRVAADGVASRVPLPDAAPNAILALASSRDGATWAGSYPGGVIRLAEGRAARVPAEGLKPADTFVLALLAARDGTVWAGTRSGALRLAPGARAFTRVPSPDGEETDAVTSLAEDAAGGVWGATRGGLLRLAPSPKRFRKRNGLSQESPVVVSRASSDGLAVAYREGLDLVVPQGDGLLVSALSSEAADRPLRVTALGRDALDSLWAGGGGLRVFRPGDAKPSLVLGREDGLVSEDASPNALVAEADGTILLGTARGLVLRRPASPRTRVPGRVTLTSIVAGSRNVRPGSEPTLGASEGPLRVRWAPVSLLGPPPVYRWSLDGAGAETTATEAVIGSLAPGEHAFEVTLAAGVPGTQEGAARFAFRVEPPWWGSAPARVAAAALAVAAFFGLVAARTRSVRSERDRLAQRVHEHELRIEALRRDLSEAGLTDPDLGVRNARFFLEAAPTDFEKSCRAYSRAATPVERRNADLLIYLVEVDGIRERLAREGRATVDGLLREVVVRLRKVVRSSDYLVRWTDTAFLVVSRSGARENGGILAGKVLSLVGEDPIALPSGAHAVTASIGWLPLPWLAEAPSTVTLDDALRLATRALAAAQEGGGDTAIGVFAPGPGEEFAGEAQIPSPGSLLAVDGRSVRLELTHRA